MSKKTIIFQETDEKLKGQDVSSNEDYYTYEWEFQ